MTWKRGQGHCITVLEKQVSGMFSSRKTTLVCQGKVFFAHSPLRPAKVRESLLLLRAHHPRSKPDILDFPRLNGWATQMEPVVHLQATEGEAVQTSKGNMEDHATEGLLNTSELPTDGTQLAQVMDPRVCHTAEGD